jgi:sigma-B regulation protein RsbU (phosphoserine phosphatase)
MRADLEAAASIQRSMLPARTGQIKTVKYSASFIPSEEIGGDMFNIVELCDSKIGLYIFDVSGHGVPAALQSVAMSRILSPYNPDASLLLDPPTDGGLSTVVSPCDVVNRLNIRFQSASSKGDFITFLYGVIDHETRTFTYTRAGHPAPIQISGGKVVDIDDKGDIPIGIIPEYDYVDNVLQLAPGDRLFFFTDGIPEASSEDGDRFGEERMVNHLAEFSELNIERCLTRLVKAVRTWLKKDTGDDDMTIMGIEIDG